MEGENERDEITEWEREKCVSCCGRYPGSSELMPCNTCSKMKTLHIYNGIWMWKKTHQQIYKNI